MNQAISQAHTAFMEALAGRNQINTGFYISLRSLPLRNTKDFESFNMLCEAAVNDGYRSVLNYISETRNLPPCSVIAEYVINNTTFNVGNIDDDEAFTAINEAIYYDETASALMQDQMIDETVGFIFKQIGTIIDYLYYMVGDHRNADLYLVKIDFQYRGRDVLIVDVKIGARDVFL